MVNFLPQSFPPLPLRAPRIARQPESRSANSARYRTMRLSLTDADIIAILNSIGQRRSRGRLIANAATIFTQNEIIMRE